MENGAARKGILRRPPKNHNKYEMMEQQQDELKLHNLQNNGNSKVIYQLQYLNLRARAEPIRLLLHYVGQKFEERSEHFEQFTKYKDNSPQVRLPKLMLLESGTEICYTNVILQYLGRKHGLLPATMEQQATAEMLGQRLQEYFDMLKPYINCLLGLAPKERLPDLIESVLKPCVWNEFGPIFESQLELNRTGYLVGETLTWVDFYTAAFTDLLCHSHGDEDSEQLFDQFAHLLRHRQMVLALRELVDYLQNRPQTLF